MDIFLEVLDKLSSWLSLLPRISAKNIVEIAIIFFSCLRAFGLDQKHQSLDSSKRPFGDFCLFSGCGAV